MRLYILRHAEAAPGEPDADRALTQKGEADLCQLGSFLRKTGTLKIDRTLHSDLLRARQSADIFSQAAHLHAKASVFPGLRPEDDPESLLSSLPKRDGNLLLVGHNPHLSSLLALIVGASQTLPGLHFKKSVIACCENQSGTNMKPGSFRLRWMIGPKLASHAPFHGSKNL